MSRRPGQAVLDFFLARKESASHSGDPAYATSIAPPLPPLAKRLNRNALTVAAVLMGITVITSLVVFNTGNHNVAESGGAWGPAEIPPAQPTFLERPVRAPTGVATDGFGNHVDESGDAWTSDRRMGPRSVQFSGPSTTAMDAMGNAGMQADVASHAATDPSAASSSPRNLRERAFLTALARSAVAASSDAGQAGGDAIETAIPKTVAASPSAGSAEDRLISYGDSVMRSSVRAATGGGSAPAQGPPSPASARRAFLTESGDLGGRSVIAHVEPAGSPYTLRAGTVIHGVLLTAIISTLPGECVGQVARDVYDSKTQRILLIPKGSKLICRYDDQVAAGQGRLLVAWTRLLLPDGRSMTLPGLALKDRQGQTGAPGNVDNHTGRVFGSALLLSAISAGAQLSQPPQTSVLAAPSAGQIAAGAMGQELSNVALEILRRGIEQPPTITVPQGRSFNVFLNGDLVFDGPYTPQS
jgi:type IV secretory pathway VirB10-like protein